MARTNADGSAPPGGEAEAPIWALLALPSGDPAPAYVQLARRIRLAVADGSLAPGVRLPSVRDVARRLGFSTSTVARAYAGLAREGVIVGRAGGGTEVASSERLDRPELERQREERLRTLARQVVVRGLALGLEPAEIVRAVETELAVHGRTRLAAPASSRPLGAEEAALLSARNRLRGRVRSLRLGEVAAEVEIDLASDQRLLVAVTRASVERLGLQEGGTTSAYVKATEPVLGP